MENKFIDYLNSMNNASSGNENALAESQVLNSFYDLIKVDREIGNRIYERLFSEKSRCVILTGHAGDGKTSLLVQILSKMGFFKQGKKPLKEFEEVVIDKKLFYVKDMSELNEIAQEENLKKSLESPANSMSSILISNTGPLINTFKRLIKKSIQLNGNVGLFNEELETFEMDFLDSIDNVCKYGQNIKIGDQEFCVDIINIAKIDNSYFISEIIDKVCNENLWEACDGCLAAYSKKCPIYFNYKCIKLNLERVKNILQSIYFWLSENESRLTIRHMVSHLSFSLTANLSCEEINKWKTKIENPLFEYAFPNLFFGYKGTEFIKESFNIKAIRELEKIKLDEKSFIKEDNVLFVKEDYSVFEEEIRGVLENELESNMLSLGINDENSQKMRRSFRRFYILVSRLEEREYENMIKQIFSEVYPLYYQLITEKIKPSKRDQIENIVFEGLYKLFIGVNPSKKENVLHLTLRKSMDEIQNVQMVLGFLYKSEIEIKADVIKNNVEKSIKKYQPYIQIRNVKYEMSHEALYYLFKVREGFIFTSYNPNFTFGLSKFKSDLIKVCKVDNDESIKLLIIKKQSMEKIKIFLEDNNLNAELGRW